MIGLSLARNTNLVDASDLINKIVERDERRSYHVYGQIMVLNLVPKKPQPKIVRRIYVTPIKKNPDAQVDLLMTMMVQSEEWRNHNNRRVDKL
jgi:hypothetical protein